MRDDSAHAPCRSLVNACLRLAQPSHYVSLSDPDFMPTFQELWEEHVEFGTTKSHKKLLGKKKKRAAVTEATPADAQASRPKKKPRAGGGDDIGAGCASAVASSSRAPTDGSQQPQPTQPACPSAAAATAQANVARAAASAAAVRSEPLANKGRWGSTMAAQLLGGGS